MVHILGELHGKVGTGYSFMLLTECTVRIESFNTIRITWNEPQIAIYASSRCFSYSIALHFHPYRDNTSLVAPVLVTSSPFNASDKEHATLSKGGWSMWSKHSLTFCLCDTVREWEAEVLCEELFDVGTLNIICFLDLDDFENLFST